jgi:hypothetical protein
MASHKAFLNDRVEHLFAHVYVPLPDGMVHDVAVFVVVVIWACVYKMRNSVDM